MKSWRKFAIRLVVVVALGVVLLATGGVGLGYFRLVENDPLNAPVRVVRISDGHLDMEDGRRIKLLLNESDFARSLKESDNWIELQPSFGDRYDIYVKRKTFICGIGAPAITIPIFPVDVPKYGRLFIDSGQVVK